MRRYDDMNTLPILGSCVMMNVSFWDQTVVIMNHPYNALHSPNGHNQRFSWCGISQTPGFPTPCARWHIICLTRLSYKQQRHRLIGWTQDSMDGLQFGDKLFFNAIKRWAWQKYSWVTRSLSLRLNMLILANSTSECETSNAEDLIQRLTSNLSASMRCKPLIVSQGGVLDF